ncbi:MAG: hypothetical protein Q9159_006760 [Coniocarpon cinnabarinum]
MFKEPRRNSTRIIHLLQFSLLRKPLMPTTDFAAAQRRISARQAAHLTPQIQHPTTTPSQQQTTSSASLPASLPTSLRILLDPFTTTTGTSPTLRVTQLDSSLLDAELLTLFKSQITEALRLYHSDISNDYDAEITLLLRAVLFKLTVWDWDASYGASLQGLRFVDAGSVIARWRRSAGGSERAVEGGREVGREGRKAGRWKKGIYGILSTAGPYAYQKWEEKLLDIETEPPSNLLRSLKKWTDRLSTLHTAAALASFLAFLVHGRYRTLLDRILGLRLTPTTSHVSREVSFEYLNRQLVWHAFTEFLLFILPLVGITRWRRFISRAWRKLLTNWRRVRGHSSEESEPEKTGELAFLPERTCAICYADQGIGSGEMTGGGGVAGSSNTDVTNPYMASCGCVYCFVCLAQRLDAEDGEEWVCVRCGEGVRECAPWHGDVQVSTDEAGGMGGERGAGKGEEVTEVEPMPTPDEREEEMLRDIEKELDGGTTLGNGEETEESPLDGGAGASWVDAEKEQSNGSHEDEEVDDEQAEDPSASLVS